MDEHLEALLVTFIQQAPTYLVLVAGMIFVLARSERHPSATLWATLGFGWLLVFGIVADIWRGMRLVEDVVPDDVAFALGEDSVWLVDALSCALFYAIQAVGFVFLIVAISVGRPWRRHPYAARSEDDRDDRGHL
jgi:hypothetical protein